MTAQVLYRAKVTRRLDTQIYIEVASLGVGMEFGPCDYVDTEVIVGDTVLVGMVEDVNEDLVIIGKLFPGTGEGIHHGLGFGFGPFGEVDFGS